MRFRASFCDPLKPDIIEMGQIQKDQVIGAFEKIPWSEHLEKMKSADQSKIYYSPSFEVENTVNKHGVVVSAVDGTEWYIFYKRPKWRKKFFGLVHSYDENYSTDVTGQSIDDARECLKALLENNLTFLEEKIK